MDSPGGPWTVIQNRENGQENFYRGWQDYKNGFGDLNGNFWLGNDKIHQLTAFPAVLRIEMTTWLNDIGHAQYSTFSIGNEAKNYKLTVSGYSGNVSSDAMANHNGMKFSTFDRDNDLYIRSCSEDFNGACGTSFVYGANLNGRCTRQNLAIFKAWCGAASTTTLTIQGYDRHV
ncbi:angiopoietin-related protein 7-like [Argopecten irradians]|uniref:angiopoietin-related protein 7-like n=1 Tax=Argopecten irradians TaxID=31199 RepID=UPI003710CD5E